MSAYKDAFQTIFSKVKEYYPNFGVGTTLNGIICDWSDTHLNGLEQAIGVDVANRVVKGCQVRFLVTVKVHCMYLAKLNYISALSKE